MFLCSQCIWPSHVQGFPAQTSSLIFCSTYRMSYRSVPFWYHLPGINIRSLRLMAQFQKAPHLPPLQMPIPSPWASDVMAVNGSLPWPLLQFSNSLQWLTEFRTSLLTRFSVCDRNTTKKQLDGRDTYGRHGNGVQGFLAHSGHPPSQHSARPAIGSTLTPSVY